MQLFLGQSNKVYIVDKTENNPVSIGGHPAWATEYDPATNAFRTMDVKTNSFCAGGNVLGNGVCPSLQRAGSQECSADRNAGHQELGSTLEGTRRSGPEV